MKIEYVLFVCLLLPSCMVQPFNGIHIKNKFRLENWMGFTTKPNRRVDIQIRRYGTNTWDTFDSTYSGFGAWNDPSGKNWYNFTHNFEYPRNSRYWSPSGFTEVRTVEDATSYVTMTGAQQGCITTSSNNSGLSWINGYVECVPDTTYSSFIYAPCEGGGCGDLPDEFEATDYPSDRSYEFANDMQGVAHNDDYWFMTSSTVTFSDWWSDTKTSRYARIPKNDVQNISSSHYIEGVFEPEYDHPGGIDYYNNWVYIALDEGNASGPAIGAIRQDKFSSPRSSSTHKILKINDGPQSVRGTLPWIARDPISGYWYSSPFDGNELYRYSIEENSSGVPQSIEFCGSIATGFDMFRIQSGVFSPSGRLYLTQDNGPETAIIILEMQSLFLGEDSSCDAEINVSPDFVGNFRINYNNDDEELEGITFWDLTDGNIPNMDGQLHIMMIDNDWASNDNFYFKHLIINPEKEL